MEKAFFINGGAGRVLCSIPALEHYAETHEDFVIVAESWGEFYAMSPKLREKAFPIHHKGLFKDHLRDKEIISPEPYRLNSYFNQKANLIQAFDILINGETASSEVPPTKKLSLDINKKDQIVGHNMIQEVKETLKKDKVIVFQPFGSTVEVQGNFIIDSSGRSFELSNVVEIIKELQKDYGIIIMSQVPIPGWEQMGVAYPKDVSLLQWAGIINAADYFLGCDSVGQHLAHAVGKPATVVIGATFPENITYPDNKDFNVIDLGLNKRLYSPIRMVFDDTSDRVNESLMVMDESVLKKIKKAIKDKIGVSKKTVIPQLSPNTDNTPLPVLPGKKASVKSSTNGFSLPGKQINKKKPIDEILELNEIKN